MSYSKTISVLMSLSLMLILSSCTTERIKYVNQPIPANLLNDCLLAVPSKPLTWRRLANYNEHLFNVIERCNADKKAIRKINHGN